MDRVSSINGGVPNRPESQMDELSDRENSVNSEVMTAELEPFCSGDDCGLSEKTL